MSPAPFVGAIQSPLTQKKLLKLIEQFQDDKGYFFVRWPHRVSGFVSTPPDALPGVEGQLFNQTYELRWKQRGQTYDALLLTVAGPDPAFVPVGEQWRVQDETAHLYPRTETRMPKGLHYPERLQIKLGQRYFIDNPTSTVQFVALRVK